MNELKIYDIKALETIPDYSFYLFIFLVVLGIGVLVLLFYFLIKKLFFKKKSLKKLALEKLKKLDLKDTKNTAYALTKYGKYFIQDQRNKRLYEELNDCLQNYKYKKKVESFDKQTSEQIKRFLDAIDV